MRHFLEFEKPIAVLEGKIEELRHMSSDMDINIAEEVSRLQQKMTREIKSAYANLGPWEKVQVARHPDRPKTASIIASLFDDFTPLAGDRNYREDHAVIGGLARFRGQSVVVMGTEKGDTTEERIKRNFGMARPEGYRKARRLMELAERFGLPVITFVDTAGAYPGRGAEERGQAEAIARSTERCLTLSVPIISLIIGEGGSGGAIAIAAANKVLMMQHAIYSVISPEGCASILYRDAAKAKDAAEAMKITADDLIKLRIVDKVVAEPVGGAHRDPQKAIAAAGKAIDKALSELSTLRPAELKAQRRDRFYTIGREGLN